MIFATFAIQRTFKKSKFVIPFIDIHSHRHNSVLQTGLISIYSFRLGIDILPPSNPIFSAGIHPWDVFQIRDYDILLGELETINAVAIGEIGLDYLRNKEEEKQQLYILERQLEIASKNALPVIIHCVRAFEPMMSILRKYDLPAIIFHGYTGSVEQTSRIKDAGYYVSLGITSLGSKKTIDGIRSCDSKRLFLETDDSEEGISDIYSTAADTLNIPQDELKKLIYENFRTIFPHL